MRTFKEGDNLTLEDVTKALLEAHDRNIPKVTPKIDRSSLRVSKDDTSSLIHGTSTGKYSVI